MFNSISFRSSSLRYAIVASLLVGGCAVAAHQLDFFDGRVVPTLELLAIAIIGIYTIFIASRIRRSDVEAVVPNRILEALDSLADGLLILDENQQILLANQAFSTAVGITTDRLIGMRAGSLSWDTEAMSDNQDFPWNLAIQSGDRQIEQLIRFRHADGSERVFSIHCSPIAGQGSKTRGALATFRDVTQIEAHRAEMNSRIRHLELLAAHDPLTDCLNRRALDPKMQAVWDLSIEMGQPLSCYMIDNDHFKQINDTYGHEIGDNVLKEVASVIRRSAPDDALVCRYGGEEFCVVLANQPIEQAAELAERTRRRVEAIRITSAKVPSISTTDLAISVSIGVSALKFGAGNPQELITQADQCLYLAKRQGRNRVVVMSASIAQLLQPEQPGQDCN